MTRIIVIDLPTETVEFNKEDVIVTEKDNGVAIIPKQGKEIGFLRQFFPWPEVRRITERDG